MLNISSFFLFALLLIAVSACGPGESTKTVFQTHEETIVADTFHYDTLKGVYFGGTELRLVLDYVSEGHAVGYSIVKGLQRNISGKVTLTPETVDIALSEPGDDRRDGMFLVSLDRVTFDIYGTWTPNNPQLKTKKFTLVKLIYDEEEQLVTTANFTTYSDLVADSIAKINFSEDGLCTYDSDGKDEAHKDQGIDFPGSWSVQAGNVVIEWQENPVFPSRKSVFKIEVNKTDGIYDLRGEGRLFSVFY